MAHRLPLLLLATIDPVVRDSMVFGLLTDSPSTVLVRHDIVDDAAGGHLRRVVMDAGGVIEDVEVPLEHACLSCAVREDALPTLRALADDGRWSSLALALPVSGESLPVALALERAMQRGGELSRVRLASVIGAVDLETFADDLLGDDLLAERGLALTADDRRSVGEAVAAQVGHVDVLVTAGDLSGVASDLVEHLRAPDGRRVDGLHDLDLRALLAGTHHADAGRRRLDPLRARAATTPGASGVWSLELASDRPFHPERLVEHVSRLGLPDVRGRGVFWVANRPDSACAWDGAGGQLSIGELESWGRRAPFTRLVMTGVGPHREALRAAFDDILLTDAEARRGLGDWLDRPDVLAPWLGERAPR
ncbi:CobW family GTP-binding protein [Actinotalea subterranea]|uniref:CobW family GTP-binding protein n=1 Tax=Actinotalea subterranea TaxID=2607497 RepID=UPI0011EF6B74|nr:GTP-binding protein [Actinotalea subterranea]